MHAAFDFVHEAYGSQALTHVVCQLAALFEHTVDAAAIGHIIEDGHRQRTRALADETNSAAQLRNVRLAVDYVFTIDKHLTVNTHTLRRIDQAVEGAQQRAFATSRRTDDAGYASFRKEQIYILENMIVSYMDIQFFYFYHLFRQLNNQDTLFLEKRAVMNLPAMLSSNTIAVSTKAAA